MKHLLIYAILFFNLIWAQNSTTLKLIDSTLLQTDRFVGVDQHSNIYHIKDNTLYKALKDTIINFQNFQLSTLNKVDIFNPLKISCHYKNLNTVSILDNRLAPIKTINFNTNLAINNISHIASGFDNNLWLFDENTGELLVYNYRNQKIIIKSIPIQDKVEQLVSNYNNCWVLTDKKIMKYNYFGILEQSLNVNEVTSFRIFNEKILLNKNNRFELIIQDKKKYIDHPFLTIEDYYLYQDYLYIYNQNYLYKFYLKE